MNRLEQALTDYLHIRRSLGFLLREPETCLRNFVALLQAEGASYITGELALRCATQATKVQPSTWAWRLGGVRRFAIRHSATEPRTEIPPAGLLPHRYRCEPPHASRVLRRFQIQPGRFRHAPGIPSQELSRRAAT